MANEELGGLIVRVGLDGLEFDKGVKNINAKLKVAQTELKAASSSFEAYGKSMDGLKAKQDALSKVYELQGRKVKELRSRYEELVKTHGENSQAALKAAQTLNNSITQYNKLGGKLQQVESEIKGLTSEIKEQGTAWSKAEKALKSFSDKAGQTGQSMMSMGQGLTAGVTAPLAALGGLALKSANDFDKAQGKMQASLGLTKSETQALSDTAKELWKEGFGENIGEVSQTMTTIEQNMSALSWATQDELKDIGKSASVLFETFDADVNDTTKTANMLITTFGVNSKKAFDMLTWGFQNGLNFSGEFLDTVNEYSPQFAAMGMSAEEMFSTFEAGAVNGAFNLDKVGDAVKEFNIRIKDGSKTTSDAMGSLSKETQGVWKSFQVGKATGKEVMDAIIAELSKMDDKVKANQIGVGVFGTQWEDLESDVVTAMGNATGELVGLENATAKAGKALQKNLGERVQQELRGLGDSLLPLGNVLMDIVEPALDGASQKIEEFTDWLNGLDKESQTTVLAIAGIVGAIGPLLTTLGLAGMGISGIITALGLLSGPVGLTILGLGGLGLAFAGLDKEMDKPVLKSDIFAGKISEATEKAVGSYMKLDKDARAELNNLALSQATITQQMSDNMVAKYQQMGDLVLKAMQENHNKQLAEQQRLFDESNVLTEEEEAKRLAQLKAEQLKEVEAHNENQARIKEIWTTAAEEKRSITDAEAKELARLQNETRVKAVEELSKSQQEQETILRNLKTNKGIIEAETAANTVKKSRETKEQVVKEAYKEFEEKKAAVELGRDVIGNIKSSEADKMIEEAERAKNKTVAKAEDMHTDVVKEAQKQAKGHIDQVDWETGEVLSDWDDMYNGVLDAINWIRGLFDKKPIEKRGSVKENGRQKQRRQNAELKPAYAKGTPSSGHPGGLAIVSEKGRELIHEPGVGTYLSGSNGPEIRNLRRGTSVLPHPNTERLLKGYGFPGYAEGIGDYFDIFLKGSGAVWDLVKDKFSLQDSLIPGWLNKHSGSPLSYIGGLAKGWIKDQWENFFGGMGSSSGGGPIGSFGGGVQRWAGIATQALMMAGQYTKENLDRLLYQMQTESGGNPHAINLWDINAKRGTPSKGLMQVN